MHSRPQKAVVFLSLAVSAAVMLAETHALAQLLACVLAGATVRFATLPGPVGGANRRTGALLGIPFVVGLLLLFIYEVAGGKARDSEPGAAVGWMLLSSWVILAAWDYRQNRRLDLAASESPGG